MKTSLSSILLLFLGILSSKAPANFPGKYTFAGKYTISQAAAGGSTQLFSDNFTRANEAPLGGNWTFQPNESGQANLTGNQVVPVLEGSDFGYYRNDVTWTADQYMEAKCTASASGVGTGPGVGVRMSTIDKIGYRCVIDGGGNIELARLLPTYTQIATRTVTYVAGGTLRLEITGTTLKIFYNSVQAGANITDSNIASGKGGIMYSSTSTGPIIDDAAGGSIP